MRSAFLILSAALSVGAAHAQQTGPDHYRAHRGRTRQDVQHAGLAEGLRDRVRLLPRLPRRRVRLLRDNGSGGRPLRLPAQPGPTRSQVAAGFVEWMKSHPNMAGDNGVDTLFRYAAEAFPCKR